MAARDTWQARQTTPVKFTLRSDEGNFGADPGVKVIVFDPLDKSGTRSAVYEVGEGQGHVRIDLEEEQYIADVRLKDLGWVTPGMIVAVRVEAGGLLLGELALQTR